MSNAFNIAFGKKLFNARKTLSLTRQELGKRLNLHETTIKRYEDGEIKTLGIDKLKEFAACLDIDPAFLMGWEDKPVKIPVFNKSGFELDCSEKKLIKKYRALDERSKAVVDTVLNAQYDAFVPKKQNEVG